MESLVLRSAPPLDPDWVAFEKELGIRPKPTHATQEEADRAVVARQPVYAADCRALLAKMLAPGARDHHLAQGIAKREFTVPSSKDGHAIPVLQLDLEGGADGGTEPETVVIYYHGGGLAVGEADSEEHSCRQIVKTAGLANPTLYSVGYRLRPQHPATTCLDDSLDAFTHISTELHPGARTLLVGSSAGGELVAFIAQTAPRGSVHGVAMRCPVVCDAPGGAEYVPERFRALHTSTDTSFNTVLQTAAPHVPPRDGLDRMPLELPAEEFRGHPKAWIQVCTNDTLYSDGLCYAQALLDAGIEAKVDVVQGGPHTFWLKAPQLNAALRADEAMLEGIAWLAK